MTFNFFFCKELSFGLICSRFSDLFIFFLYKSAQFNIIWMRKLCLKMQKRENNYVWKSIHLFRAPTIDFVWKTMIDYIKLSCLFAVWWKNWLNWVRVTIRPCRLVLNWSNSIGCIARITIDFCCWYFWNSFYLVRAVQCHLVCSNRIKCATMFHCDACLSTHGFSLLSFRQCTLFTKHLRWQLWQLNRYVCFSFNSISNFYQHSRTEALRSRQLHTIHFYRFRSYCCEYFFVHQCCSFRLYFQKLKLKNRKEKTI